VPRAGLTGPIVIAEAGRLADEAGLDGLTLAALAARLGVAVPSLYKHVDGLGALRRGVAIAALHDLGAAIGAASGLRACAHAYRDWARAHPGSYAATLRAAPADDPQYEAAAVEVLDVVYAVLAGHGLAGDGAVDGARLLRSTLHGFVTLEAAGGFGMPRDVERSFERLLDALDLGLTVLGPSGSAGRVGRPTHETDR
jgi:AcrR family transcriptional regulator